MDAVQETLKRAANLSAQLLKPSKACLAAQDLMKLPNAAVKFGVLRKKPKHIIKKKWPRRFVMLLKDNIYIYQDEMSVSPKSQLLLQCFNQVRRSGPETHEWSFSIVADSDLKTISTLTFACISDEERLDWMQAFSEQLFSAHGLPRAPYDGDVGRHFNQDCGRDYESLERVVGARVKTYTATSGLADSGSSSSGYSDSCSDSQSGGRCSGFAALLTTESATVPPKRKPAILPKPKIALPLPLSPPSRSPTVELPVENLDDTYDLPTTETLEDRCTVHEDADNRELLISRLKATESPGTYLIRSSRQDNQKVLSYLAQVDVVKEYKIFKIGQAYSLDKTLLFDSVEKLLQAYSNNTYLPMSSYYLLDGYFSRKKSNI